MLNEIFSTQWRQLDAKGFFDVLPLCKLLDKKIKLADYSYKTWASVFETNPSLGIHEMGKFKFTPQKKKQQNKTPPKLTPLQIRDFCLIMKEIFDSKESDVDADGFLEMKPIYPLLNKKITLKNFQYKSWKSLFNNNPELGEYKKIGDQLKFKLKR